MCIIIVSLRLRYFSQRNQVFDYCIVRQMNCEDLQDEVFIQDSVLATDSVVSNGRLLSI